MSAVKATRWRFSLRQLLLVMTVTAVVMILVSHHWRFVVGLVALVSVLLEIFYPVLGLFAEILDPRNWRTLPERKPTASEVKEAAEKIAARYPKQPQATTGSGKQSDSR